MECRMRISLGRLLKRLYYENAYYTRASCVVARNYPSRILIMIVRAIADPQLAA